MAEWISVEERLPTEGELVLGIMKLYTSDCFVLCRFYTNPCRWLDQYYFPINHTIFVWQPLPEPYKEGEENG